MLFTSGSISAASAPTAAPTRSLRTGLAVAVLSFGAGRSSGTGRAVVSWTRRIGTRSGAPLIRWSVFCCSVMRRWGVTGDAVAAADTCTRCALPGGRCAAPSVRAAARGSPGRPARRAGSRRAASSRTVLSLMSSATACIVVLTDQPKSATSIAVTSCRALRISQLSACVGRPGCAASGGL